MDEFDFTDGLKIVLVSVFMLGSVQLHALIDESSERAADRTERFASPAPVDRRFTETSDEFQDGDNRLRRELPMLRT